MFMFSLAMSGVVERSYQYKPQKCPAETGQGQTVSAEKEKNAIPKCPVQNPEGNHINRLGNRPPFLILFKGIHTNTRIIQKISHPLIFFPVQVFRYALMIHIGKHAIHKLSL